MAESEYTCPDDTCHVCTLHQQSNGNNIGNRSNISKMRTSCIFINLYFVQHSRHLHTSHHFDNLFCSYLNYPSSIFFFFFLFIRFSSGDVLSVLTCCFLSCYPQIAKYHRHSWHLMVCIQESVFTIY